jgi:hypothetical protein
MGRAHPSETLEGSQLHRAHIGRSGDARRLSAAKQKNVGIPVAVTCDEAALNLHALSIDQGDRAIDARDDAGPYSRAGSPTASAIAFRTPFRARTYCQRLAAISNGAGAGIAVGAHLPSSHSGR